MKLQRFCASRTISHVSLWHILEGKGWSKHSCHFIVVTIKHILTYWISTFLTAADESFLFLLKYLAACKELGKSMKINVHSIFWLDKKYFMLPVYMKSYIYCVIFSSVKIIIICSKIYFEDCIVAFDKRCDKFVIPEACSYLSLVAQSFT